VAGEDGGDGGDGEFCVEARGVTVTSGGGGSAGDSEATFAL